MCMELRALNSSASTPLPQLYSLNSVVSSRSLNAVCDLHRLRVEFVQEPPDGELPKPGWHAPLGPSSGGFLASAVRNYAERQADTANAEAARLNKKRLAQVAKRAQTKERLAQVKELRKDEEAEMLRVTKQKRAAEKQKAKSAEQNSEEKDEATDSESSEDEAGDDGVKKKKKRKRDPIHVISDDDEEADFEDEGDSERSAKALKLSEGSDAASASASSSSSSSSSVSDVRGVECVALRSWD